MDIDILKREAQRKPSKVAFRRISDDDAVSVKFRSGAEMCMPDEYEWSRNGEPIREREAVDLLKDFIDK